MNDTNLNQIFDQYIKVFSIINNETNAEYTKWQTAYQFPILMNNALAKDGPEFVAGLEIVRKCTGDFIDAKMQSFRGMVQLSRKEPASVKELFEELYADDGGNLMKRSHFVARFITRSNELIEQYFPDSPLFLQNDQSAMAYLFFYDPEHHFMYEGALSRHFGDIIEYFEDWGAGIKLNLALYEQMCEQVVAKILENPVIRFLDMSRFDGRLSMKAGQLHPDEAKHILLYDIMHCTCQYHLDEGISYKRLTAKDRRNMLAEREAARPVIEEYQRAKEEADELNEVMDYILSHVKAGDQVRHGRFGMGEVTEITPDSISIHYEAQDKTMKLILAVLLANRAVHFENADVEARIEVYSDVLKRYDTIPKYLKYAEEKIAPYRKYMGSL